MPTVLTPRQQRRADRRRVREDNKTRQKLERAMRDNGALGRLIAAQRALRDPETAKAIYRRVKEQEMACGPIEKYEAIRAIVQTVLSEMGLDLADVMFKFQFGPGCGICDHPHKDQEACAFPGCECRAWTPARVLGIAAAPAPDAIREAARQAGVEARLDRPV